MQGNDKCSSPGPPRIKTSPGEVQMDNEGQKTYTSGSPQVSVHCAVFYSNGTADLLLETAV